MSLPFAGYRQHPPGGGVLPGSGALQHPAKNPLGWDPLIGNQAALPGGGAAPLQCAHVPTHLRHQPAQTSAEAARYISKLFEVFLSRLYEFQSTTAF